MVDTGWSHSRIDYLGSVLEPIGIMWWLDWTNLNHIPITSRDYIELSN